jgi:16S rRNA (guanine527-N7)-methyltransferase
VPEDQASEPFGPEAFAAAADVSRETLARLKAYADLLIDWNSRHNLVSRAGLDDLWRRHMWDSAQLVRYLPQKAATLADLGSGAGFPGLVLAVLRPDIAVTLFEARTKKCAFLNAAAARMGVKVSVVDARIEDVAPRPLDVVTARGCAPLPRLLGLAHRFTGSSTVCLFLKGQNVGAELTEAHKYWNMKASHFPSLSDPSGAILEVRELEPHERPRPTKPARKKAPRSGRRQSERRRG